MKPTSPSRPAPPSPHGGDATPPPSAYAYQASSPRSRVLIYALAQARAYLAGQPLPALPAGEHHDDLLNDEETAAVLGVTPSTVRAYASQGYLSPGKTLYSVRVWPRHDIEERLKKPARARKGRRTPTRHRKRPAQSTRL